MRCSPGRGEFKPVDSIPDDAKEKVLPEAEEISERRRARVRLPSGKILRVGASVLLEYCHALKDHAAELLAGVVWLTYLPASAAWCDQHVEEFFDCLHKDRLENGFIQQEGMWWEYDSLSYVLDR